MATNVIAGSALGTTLSSLLLCDEIQPGAVPSYEICKVIYTYHPLGQKMAESPIRMAQFLPRKITIADGPEEDLRKAFIDQWVRDDNEETICQFGTLARVYGISSFALLTKGETPDQPLDIRKLATIPISYNVLDPLNTSGSLVLNQDPNAFDFQKHQDIRVNAVTYHRSRTLTLMHERPIYIEYTTSAFGFVGRSVYQRALFPLKSFVQTMIADDMVARKVGLIVAMLKMAGTIADAVMVFAAAFKRTLLKVGATDNVISLAVGEDVKSLDLTNLEGPLSMSRKHILENCAAAGDMPAQLLNAETFAEGFGEGTEDAKKVAAFIDGIRTWLQPAYKFLDTTTQRRAWNADFYKSLQVKYPEYKNVPYEQAFYQWSNSFAAGWPPLIQEPESEQVRVAEIKLKSVIAAGQVFLPEMDPTNQVSLFRWMEDEINNTPLIFSAPLQLDYDSLQKHLEEQKDKLETAMEEPDTPPPFSAHDSAGRRGVLASYLGAPTTNEDIRSRITHIENWIKRKKI